MSGLESVTLSGVALAIATFAIATIAQAIARPLGGLIYTIPMAPLVIPGVGRAYRILFIDTLHISFLFKIIAMIFSASGILMLMMAVEALTPEWSRNAAVQWGWLAAATVASLGVLERVHMMEIPRIDDSLPILVKLLRLKDGQIDQAREQLAHVHFAEMTLIDFLVLLVTFGISLYSADALGMFDGPRSILTPLQGIASALGSIQIVVADVHGPVGVGAIIIRGFYGLSLIIYTVFFLAISTNLIPRDPKPTAEETVRAFTAGFQAGSDAAQARRPALGDWLRSLLRNRDSDRS